jgi:mRNA interferase HigB
MRIISRKTLKIFWERHPDAEQPLKAWFQETEKANWSSFNELKKQFKSASLVGNDRVVFNIKGNVYRLIVLAMFKQGKFFIRFVGTHKEYDKINVKNI